MPKIHQPQRLFALVCAALATGALAQEQAAEEPTHLAQAPLERHIERQIIFGEGGEPPAYAGGEMRPERVVKGAPYCADAVHEAVQWLADANGSASNRIVRQQASRMCRDGEGRTRQEFERNGHKIVYLRDPVARENWVLDAERKTARRLSGAGPLMDPAALQEFTERVKEFARSAVERGRPGATPVAPLPPLPPAAPQPVIISTPDGAAPGAQVRIVRIQRGDADGAAVDWPAPPPVQWQAQHGAPRGAGTATPLPGREIEGLRANGERTTWVIEAGKIGNDKPIQIIREVWTAPELMVTVSSRDFDPRSGEVNYRLRNLKRGEPDAALMRVPADYGRPARPAPRASGPTG